MTIQVRSCDVCRTDGSWHYDTNGKATRCPNWLAAEQHKEALALTAQAHVDALKAAKAIVRDFAETHARFSSNNTRAAMQDAGIPSPIVGVAFRSCAEAGLIEACGTVRNTDDNTRHRVYEYRSLIHSSAVAAGVTQTRREAS